MRGLRHAILNFRFHLFEGCLAGFVALFDLQNDEALADFEGIGNVALLLT